MDSTFQMNLLDEMLMSLSLMLAGYRTILLIFLKPSIHIKLPSDMSWFLPQHMNYLPRIHPLTTNDQSQ
ncbi:hypothetical protein EYC80_005098 [Monilinia laxa]|uniref:Uncharacterized protein n=1 Tax=Monilinia laxa TaxID=61186 RepID=A0A5N6KIW5_MONLA|nr:hypothetical protein EYC80_005098 [Monilinia laxa]